jgi:hypothetical protein
VIKIKQTKQQIYIQILETGFYSFVIAGIL